MHKWGVAAVAAFVISGLASTASAQVRVVVVEGTKGPDGTGIRQPQAPSIDDNGDVLFRGNTTDNCALFIARRDKIECVAKILGPVPGGTLASIGHADVQFETAPLRGTWAVFTGTLSDGKHSLFAWDSGTLTELGADGDPIVTAGNLDVKLEWNLTNALGQTLAMESTTRLWLISKSGMLSSIVSKDDPIPGALGWHLFAFGNQPMLDDEGRVLIRVTKFSSKSEEASTLLFGKKDMLFNLEPTGLGEKDKFALGPYGLGSGGQVAFEATVTPETGMPYTWIWSGSPGSHMPTVKFPLSLVTGTRKVLETDGNPPLVAAGGRYAFKGQIESTPGKTVEGIVTHDVSGDQLVAAVGMVLRGKETWEATAVGKFGIADSGEVFFEATYKDTLGTSAPIGTAIFARTAAGDGRKVLGTGDMIDMGAPYGLVKIEHVALRQSIGAGYARAVSPKGVAVIEVGFGEDLNQAIVVTEAPKPGADLKLDAIGPATAKGCFWPIAVTIENVGTTPATGFSIEGRVFGAGTTVKFPTQLRQATGDSARKLNCSGGACVYEGGPVAPGTKLTFEGVELDVPGGSWSVDLSLLSAGDPNPSNDLFRVGYTSFDKAICGAPPEATSPCSCTTPGTSGSSFAAIGAGVGLALAWVGRRRKSVSRPSGKRPDR